MTKAEQIKAAHISKILDEANGSWKDLAEDGYDAGYSQAIEDNWINVDERLPTKEDVFDEYDEVLTIQVGRKRPTMMKYWEVKHCPFTKLWLAVPPLPTPTNK